MPAHYSQTVVHFINSPVDDIIGKLTSEAAASGYYQQFGSQTISWREQIEILKQTFNKLKNHPQVEEWTILLEFPIPRRAKRIDTVLLAEGRAIIIEFKCGALIYDPAAVLQVEDYCLDIKDFHKPSRELMLFPMLIATNAPTDFSPIKVRGQIGSVVKANRYDIADRLDNILRFPIDVSMIDGEQWNNGEYLPTPTIIEAAQHLYAGQNVQEISRCHAGIDNLTRSTNGIISAIKQAQTNRDKLICFVTGVPGSGKTLAGLNVVHNKKLHDGELGSFLSGNGPLVKVLTESLARDHKKRSGSILKESRREVETFIHNVHRFINTYYSEHNLVPVDNIVVFDEAQRAWDAAQSKRKFNRPFSEPELMLSIMDRHKDYAIIIALVGGGQEINSGEAGLSEWGRTLREKFPHWHVIVSPLLLTGTYAGNPGLFLDCPTTMRVTTEDYLHLDVCIRSYKAENLTKWVDLILNRNIAAAREVVSELKDYPIVLTRSLDTARAWLKGNHLGTRRIGIIASSGARRLRAFGLDVTNKIDVAEWFLNPPGDVRASFALETVATEFDIQGLELDWTCIAWGLDLIPEEFGWKFNRFKGTKWQHVNNDIIRRYILNKYRVLLTRAREGMVIWVPEGDIDDFTRPPASYDAIAAYLKECGVPEVI